MKSIMDIAKEEERKEFLKRSPLERMTIMHELFLQFVSLKAKGEGISEYEIYSRYLARKIHRDKKLARLLNPPPEEELKEMPEEYL